MDRELVRASRGLLGWSQEDLARRAGVNRRVVAAYESGERVPHQRNMESLRAAIENAGVELVSRQDGTIGVVIGADALARVRAVASSTIQSDNPAATS